MVIALTATVRASWSEAPWDFIQKNARQGVRQEGQADEDDAPDAEAGEDRTVDRARRPLHDIELVRLEGEDETERDRGHHVDPEHLGRRDRHGEAEEDGYRNDQRLGDVGRQHEQDRFLDVVVDGATFPDAPQ